MSERPPPEPVQRLLRFALGTGSWAIAIDRVSGVGRCERLYPVPGAPPTVLGLAQWQSSAVAVLDCARLLGERPLAEDSCLLRLAPPFQATALFVSSHIELAEADHPAQPDEPVTVAGRPVRIVDPLVLLRRVERELRRR